MLIGSFIQALAGQLVGKCARPIEAPSKLHQMRKISTTAQAPSRDIRKECEAPLLLDQKWKVQMQLGHLPVLRFRACPEHPDPAPAADSRPVECRNVWAGRKELSVITSTQPELALVARITSWPRNPTCTCLAQLILTFQSMCLLPCPCVPCKRQYLTSNPHPDALPYLTD